MLQNAPYGFHGLSRAGSHRFFAVEWYDYGGEYHTGHQP